MPQYFVVTPKLLPDLEMSEKMTVHHVLNGSFGLSHDVIT